MRRSAQWTLWVSIALTSLSCAGSGSPPSETETPDSSIEDTGPYMLGRRQCASNPERLYERTGTRDSSVIAEEFFGELQSPAREQAIQGCRDALAEHASKSQ